MTSGGSVTKLEIEQRIYELRILRAKHYENDDMDVAFDINRQLNMLRKMKEEAK